jgi:hypothetical protein
VVKFTPRPHYPGKGSRYPLNRRVGGPQRLYEHFEEDKNMFPVGTGTAELPAHRLIIVSGMFGKMSNWKGDGRKGRDLIGCQPCIFLEALRKITETLVKMAVVTAEIPSNHRLSPSAR